MAITIVALMANVRVYGSAKPGSTGDGSPLIAGLLVGIVLMIAWILLARMTHKDVGLASWGVGGRSVTAGASVLAVDAATAMIAISAHRRTCRAAKTRTAVCGGRAQRRGLHGAPGPFAGAASAPLALTRRVMLWT